MGSAAASALRHAGVPRLRRADVAARDRGARGAGAGARRQALPAAPQQPRLPDLFAGAGRGEQVAGRALRPRRPADRLRQAHRKCRCASWRSSCSSSWTTWWTSWAAGRRSATSTPSSPKARAPIGSCRYTSRRAICARSSAGWWMKPRGPRGGRMKVGLLCGREYSFPPAFIDRVNTLGRDHGITRGDRHAHRHEDGRAVRVPRDRRPHLARGRVLPRVPEARRARRAPTSSTTRSGGRRTTSSSTTPSRRRSASRSRRRSCCRRSPIRPAST